MSSCLPDVWRHIRSSFFDGQHHYGYNDRDSDAGEDSQSAGSDQLVRILQKYRAKPVGMLTFANSIKHFIQLRLMGMFCRYLVINQGIGQINILV